MLKSPLRAHLVLAAFFAFIAMDGDSIYIRQVLLSKTWCNKLSRMTICYYCSLKQIVFLPSRPRMADYFQARFFERKFLKTRKLQDVIF